MGHTYSNYICGKQSQSYKRGGLSRGWFLRRGTTVKILRIVFAKSGASMAAPDAPICMPMLGKIYPFLLHAFLSLQY